MKYDVAVVGGGAAGSMGALRGVLNNNKVICFQGDAPAKKRSRATWVGKVENMPVLFEKPKAVFQSANEVFKWIETHPLWSQNLNFVKQGVTKISGSEGDFTLKTSKGESFQAKYIVLCTGIMDRQPEINGEIKPVFPMANEGHIEYCIRCDGHKTKGKKTAVIGHSETAGWIAALLHERYQCPKMTVLTNGQPFESPEDSTIRERMKCYGVELNESAIVEILGDPKKELEGFKLANGSTIEAQIAFVSLGVIVYNELAKDLGCKVDERGYVETDDSGLTTIPGIFAAGDLRANKKKQIYTAWDITVDSLDKIDSYIRREKRDQWLKDCSGNQDEEKSGARM